MIELTRLRLPIEAVFTNPLYKPELFQQVSLFLEPEEKVEVAVALRGHLKGSTNLMKTCVIKAIWAFFLHSNPPFLNNSKEVIYALPEEARSISLCIEQHRLSFEEALSALIKNAKDDFYDFTVRLKFSVFSEYAFNKLFEFPDNFTKVTKKDFPLCKVYHDRVERFEKIQRIYASVSKNERDSFLNEINNWKRNLKGTKVSTLQ